MGLEDQRDFIKFYGIVYPDWEITFGIFTEHTEQLVSDYISDACLTTEYTQAGNPNWGLIELDFLFPHHIKKQYYIEGVIEGEITVACNGDDSTISDYRVSIYKTNGDDLGVELLVTSDWIVVDDLLEWDDVNEVGDEVTYNYKIEAWDDVYELLTEDRIFVKIQVRFDNNHGVLMHANDSEWHDVWIKLPFRL